MATKTTAKKKTTASKGGKPTVSKAKKVVKNLPVGVYAEKNPDSHKVSGKYTFFYETEKSYDAVFDSIYDSDNSLDEDAEEYAEYKCISFKDISNGILFEINYRQMPSRAICDGEIIY